MSSVSTSAEEKLCLALSGGGFRATLFHLGVVRALAESGKLGSTKLMTSVSGGSVLAAHLILNWERYSPASGFNATSFDDAAAEILSLVRHNVRGRITQSMLWQTGWRSLKRAVRRVRLVLGSGADEWWDRSMSDSTATASLDRRLNRQLFRGAKLKDLGSTNSTGDTIAPTDRPTLWIMATNLTQACACHFSYQGFTLSLNKAVSPAGREVLRVSQAVAASAAFPGFFPALKLFRSVVTWDEKQFSNDTVFVADGGVIDNLGCSGVLELCRTDPPSVIVVSDASGVVNWNITNRMGFTFGTAFRTVEVMTAQLVDGTRSSLPQQCKANSLPEPALWTITRVHAAKNSLSEETQKVIPKLRTDFDKFSDLEIACLIRHGYEVAWEGIRKQWPSLKGPAKPLESCGGLTFGLNTKSPEKLVKTIRQGSVRNLWLIAWSLPVFWIIPIFLFVLAGSGWLYWEKLERAAARQEELSQQAEAERARRSRELEAEHIRREQLLRKEEAERIQQAHDLARLERWRQLATMLQSVPFAPIVSRTVTWPVPPDTIELGGFQVVREERIFDLRGWRRNVEAVPATDLHDPKRESSAVVRVRMTVKKDRGVSSLSIPIATNGTDVVVQLPDGTTPTLYLEQEAQNGAAPSNRKLILRVPVINEEPDKEFEIRFIATFWNALQEPDKTFVGVPVVSPGQSVSLLVVWPDWMELPACEHAFADLSKLNDPPALAGNTGQQHLDAKARFTAWHVPECKAQTAVVLGWSWPLTAPPKAN